MTVRSAIRAFGTESLRYRGFNRDYKKGCERTGRLQGAIAGFAGGLLEMAGRLETLAACAQTAIVSTKNR